MATAPLLFLAACLLTVRPAFAQNTAEASIPVEASGQPCTVTMAAQAGEPLPENSTQAVSPGTEAVFGPVSYMEPGDYHYTLSDGKTVYRATVQVTEDRDGNLSAAVYSVGADGNKNGTIVFRNGSGKNAGGEQESQNSKTAQGAEIRQDRSAAPSKTVSVKTGDRSHAVLFLFLSVLCGSGLAALLGRRSRQ